MNKNFEKSMCYYNLVNFRNSTVARKRSEELLRRCQNDDGNYAKTSFGPYFGISTNNKSPALRVK